MDENQIFEAVKKVVVEQLGVILGLSGQGDAVLVKLEAADGRVDAVPQGDVLCSVVRGVAVHADLIGVCPTKAVSGHVVL